MLFVLGLLLIVQDRWMLLKTVTAFTVAHSLTLAIATFGYASAPVLPLNAAIALSILFLGPEIVKSWRGETSLTIRKPWLVAFLFGLLHGFGFASALTSAGLPPKGPAARLAELQHRRRDRPGLVHRHHPAARTRLPPVGDPLAAMGAGRSRLRRGRARRFLDHSTDGDSTSGGRDEAAGSILAAAGVSRHGDGPHAGRRSARFPVRAQAPRSPEWTTCSP